MAERIGGVPGGENFSKLKLRQRLRVNDRENSFGSTMSSLIASG